MGAFAYCTQLVSLNVGAHKDIPELAFYGCEKLESVNLENVETIGSNAFANATSLKEVNLSSATSVGEYAFALSGLVKVTLNENGTDLDMGAFAYCEDLNKVDNLGASRNIASYAFAYSGLTSADITNAETLGDHVFIKEVLTPFEVIYGKSLKSVGDNPFALCQVAPFVERTEYEFNGTYRCKNCG